jgi:hypothetical protein
MFGGDGGADGCSRLHEVVNVALMSIVVTDEFATDVAPSTFIRILPRILGCKEC